MSTRTECEDAFERVKGNDPLFWVTWASFDEHTQQLVKMSWMSGYAQAMLDALLDQKIKESYDDE